MNKPNRIAVAALFLAIVACIIAGVSWWDLRRNLAATRGDVQSDGERVSEATPAPSPAWLTGMTEERFGRIEQHLRGLDQAMAEIGYRYGELHFAARDRNWDYAKYQTEKIDLTMRL